MIAIIPARGGSKGLPRKNILPFCGKPLIAYTIEAALSAESVGRVVVSTDDPEIAEVAVAHGAEVPFLRPAELAGDSARAVDVYRYTISRLGEEQGGLPEECVVLLPTAPFRQSRHIDEAVGIFHERQAESVISVVPFDPPVSWALEETKDGRICPLFSDLPMKNRQEENQAYCPNGAIYVFSVPYLMVNDSYYGDRTYPYVMSGDDSVDIDTIRDFQWGEFLMSKLMSDTVRE